MRSSEGHVARIYGLPKIHKQNIPLRPIVSMIRTPMYNLSKYLCPFIKSIVAEEYIVKNSSDFTEHLKMLNINSDEIQASFDVVSLFTNIPVKLATDIILEKLSVCWTDFDVQLTIEEFKNAFLLCCSNIVFTFHDEHYKQTDGFPMGLPPIPHIANVVMNHIEKYALTTFPNPPRFYKRMVDDAYTIIK